MGSVRHGWRLVTGAMAVGVLLVGCGDDASDEPSGSPPAAQSTSSADDDGSTSDDCGGVAATVQGHLDRPEVSGVTVVGQCTSLTIATSLDDGAADVGKEICDSAAEVGYVDDVANISVNAESGRELAIGLSGSDCIAEP
jgi:hypothetical protein